MTIQIPEPVLQKVAEYEEGSIAVREITHTIFEIYNPVLETHIAYVDPEGKTIYPILDPEKEHGNEAHKYGWV